MQESKFFKTALIGLVLMVLFALSSCGGSNDEQVMMVKAGKLSAYPNKTVGEAIDGFFANPSWSSGTSESGTEFVNAVGKITFMNKEVKAVLQFKIDKAKKTIEVSALEFNDIAQNKLMLTSLLSKVFEK